jgi:hypothetical protein
MMQRLLVLVLVIAAGCGGRSPLVRSPDVWPNEVDDYEDVTENWTRSAVMRSTYQEALEVAATFKSAEWRAADAARDAEARGLTGDARTQRLMQAKAEAAGPYELELMVTTWDRRENDLHHGAKSVWRVRLLDHHGNEIEPLEIVQDKRPETIIRVQFPAFPVGFAKAYVARCPRGTKPLLGPGEKLRLRVSSTRGGLELTWQARGS